MSASLPLDDVEQIFVVLAVLYTVESCWWLRGEARRFFPGTFSRWTDRPSDTPLAAGWRLTLGNPWPGGEAFAAQPFPFPFDEFRLLMPVIQSETGRERYHAVEYGALGPFTADNRAVLEGTRVIGEYSSHALASSIAETLERVRNSEPEERRQVADETLAERWSQPAAGRQLAAWRHDARVSRSLGRLLAFLGFVIGPLVYVGRGTLPTWLPQGVLLAFLVTWLATAISGLRLRSFQLGSDPHRTTHQLVPFLSPASAMRLSEAIGRDVLARYEPLVAALLTSDDSGPESVSSAWLRQTIYPAHEADSPVSPEVAGTLARYQRRCQRYARQAVRAAGYDLETLLAPPGMASDALAYCPRCLRLFRDDPAQCRSCGLAATSF